MINFNPIIVLFLTYIVPDNSKRLGHFNPIIVLFLTFPAAVIIAVVVFQSYYSLIFNFKRSMLLKCCIIISILL